MLSPTLPIALSGAVTYLVVFTHALDLNEPRLRIADDPDNGCTVQAVNICGCKIGILELDAPGWGKGAHCAAMALSLHKHLAPVGIVTGELNGCRNGNNISVNLTPPDPDTGYPITILSKDHQCSMGCTLDHVEKLSPTDMNNMQRECVVT